MVWRSKERIFFLLCLKLPWKWRGAQKKIDDHDSRTWGVLDYFKAFKRNLKIDTAIRYCWLQHCLPNCEETTYKATVSAAPFRRCDFKTLGMNPLCDLNTFEETDEGLRDMNPPIWGTSAFNHYRQDHGRFPGPLVHSFKLLVDGHTFTLPNQYLIHI